MRALPAIGRGMGRALGAPRLVFWLWLINLMTALPAAVLIEEHLGEQIGASRVAESLRQGFDLVWHGEVEQRSAGFEASFEPSRLGGGAVFHNLDDWLSGRLFSRSPALLAIGLGYGLVWIVLLGGVLEQLARPTPGQAIGRILSAGGRTFFRLTRVAGLAAGLYYLVYRLARTVFPWIDRATRDVTAEKTVLAYNLIAAAGIAVLLLFVRLVFDYAKIALVVEERRSALFAVLGGLAFALRHPLRSAGVVGGFLVFAGLVTALYSAVAPGFGQASWVALVLAFLGSQLFIAARLALRVGLLGAETALYRDRRQGALPPPL